MWAAIGNAIKKMAKRTALKAASGDESSQKKILIVIIATISVFLIIIVTIITVIFGPILIGKEYIRQAKESTGVLFEKIGNVLTLKGWCAVSDGSCSKNAEQAYYEELNDVYENYKNRNITIDEQLITATIFYGYAKEVNLDEVDENGYNQGFIDFYCEVNAIGWAENIGCPQYVKLNYDDIYSNNFEKYKKVKTNYDNLYKTYCTQDSFLQKLNNLNPGMNIVNNGRKELCQYYLWNYADLETVKTDETYLIYSEGKNDIKLLAKEMVSGNSLNFSNYKKYLIDEYIPNNFENLIDNSDREKSIEKIADEIMKFASVKEGSNNYAGGSCVVYSCNTVFLTGDYAGEYSLEDYVKGVVNAESGGFQSYVKNYQEEWKAQAIAARSMVLSRYDICNQSVPNTFQRFKPGWSEEISNVVDETVGLVLMDDNNIYSAEYDAFYIGNDYYCDDKLCHSKYYIRGSGTNQNAWDTHIIDTYSKFASSFLAPPNGHGRGMSQWGAAYLADNGKKYDEILNYYYADNIKIAKIGNTCSTNTDVSGYDWRQADPRWGSRSYGAATLASVGCNLTSIAIEIARSGVQTVISDFNPGTLFDFMKARGHLGYSGATLNYAAFSEVAPDFKYAGSRDLNGLSHEQIKDILAQLIDDNKYPIVHVKSQNSLPYSTNNHWVAVVGYAQDDIEIVDPASTGCTRLFTCKPGLDRSNGYGIVDIVQYWN